MPFEELATRIGAVVFMFIGSIMLIAALIYPLTFYRQFFDPAGGRKALKPAVIVMYIALASLFIAIGFMKERNWEEVLWGEICLPLFLLIFYGISLLQLKYSENLLRKNRPLQGFLEEMNRRARLK